jgi:hypothetical protein
VAKRLMDLFLLRRLERCAFSKSLTKVKFFIVLCGERNLTGECLVFPRLLLIDSAVVW